MAAVKYSGRSVWVVAAISGGSIGHCNRCTCGPAAARRDGSFRLAGDRPCSGPGSLSGAIEIRGYFTYLLTSLDLRVRISYSTM